MLEYELFSSFPLDTSEQPKFEQGAGYQTNSTRFTQFNSKERTQVLLIFYKQEIDN
jgi:hypothetical protein